MDTGAREVLLLDGVESRESSWFVSCFAPGDLVRLAAADDVVYQVTVCEPDERQPGIWRLALGAADGAAGALDLTVPRQMRLIGERMVRTLSAQCSNRGCETVLEVSADTSALGQAEIKMGFCSAH